MNGVCCIFFLTYAFLSWKFIVGGQANKLPRQSKKSTTLFCPGIPGAGKTILATLVFDHPQRNFQGRDVGVAFIYCDFRHRDDQAVDQLIGNLVKQLLSIKLPPLRAVGDLHSRYRAHQSRPSLNDLQNMFHAIAVVYKDGVFIVVHALDECQNSNDTHSRFIKTLLSLHTGKSDFNILATS